MRLTCSSCQVSIEIDRTKLDRRRNEQDVAAFVGDLKLA